MKTVWRNQTYGNHKFRCYIEQSKSFHNTNIHLTVYIIQDLDANRDARDFYDALVCRQRKKQWSTHSVRRNDKVDHLFNQKDWIYFGAMRTRDHVIIDHILIKKRDHSFRKYRYLFLSSRVGTLHTSAGALEVTCDAVDQYAICHGGYKIQLVSCSMPPCAAARQARDSSNLWCMPLRYGQVFARSKDWFVHRSKSRNRIATDETNVVVEVNYCVSRYRYNPDLWNK